MTTFHPKIPASVFKGIAFGSEIGKLSHLGSVTRIKFDHIFSIMGFIKSSN